MADPGRVHTVEEAETGTRLDVFLAERLRLSRAQVRRLLARGAVRVDGREADTGAKGVPVSAGARVEVLPFERPEAQAAPAEPEQPLRELASGPGWVAVDKPAGLPVHPLREDERGTVLGALLARHPGMQGVGEGGLRSGVVHRLDVDTTGVLLFATQEDAWQRLRAAFREHRVDKSYRALVRGELDDSGEIELPLVVGRHRPAVVRVAKPGERARGARTAVTRWRVLERFGSAALVEARPVTGFLHQIRVTLAWLGAPVLGDRVYDPRAARTPAPRHMLHASRLHLEEIAAQSPDPIDFGDVLDFLTSAKEGRS